MKYDVFISYSSKDQKVVEAMCAYLEQHMVRCFVAYRDIPKGVVWAKAIVEALDESKMMVVVFSEEFNLSDQVDREIELASEGKKPILTFRISDAMFKGAKKYYLKNINWIDAFPDPEKVFDALLDNVYKLIGQPDGHKSEVDTAVSKMPYDQEVVAEPLCPCGSGKLFKDCHGKSLSSVSKVAADNKPQTQDSGDFVLKVKGIEYPMVYVQGGTFKMEGGNCSKNDKAVHSVTLSDYRIGKYEVTQEFWEAVMGNNPSHFKGPRRPVDSVSWYDCQEFISKLNSLTGKDFKLPTEAQWEYAARGGKKSKGYKYSGSNFIQDIAWCRYNSGGETHDVGTKIPNELGLYDMTGNVGEWCADWIESLYNLYRVSSQTNPVGPASGFHRVVRGGSWRDGFVGSYLDIFYDRLGVVPSDCYYENGFRLCL